MSDVLTYLFDTYSPGKPCDFGTPDCTVDHSASEDAVMAGVLCDVEVAVIETRQDYLKVTAGRWFDSFESVPLVALGGAVQAELSPASAGDGPAVCGRRRGGGAVMSWTVDPDDPRYNGDRHPAGPVERAIDKAVERVSGRCRWACGDVECPDMCPNRPRDQARPLPDPPPRPGKPAKVAPVVPTDEQVEHLSGAVDRAFNERDRLFDVWVATGRDEDEQAMLRQDRHADRLLTQYNAACQAQYAEVDRRRAENLARYRQEQTERDMERDGGGGIDMPPAAEPYRPAKPSTSPSTTTTGGTGMSDDAYKAQLAEVERQRTEYRKFRNWKLGKPSSTTTTGGGTGMSGGGIDQVKADIMMAKDKILECSGPINQAIAEVEAAIAALMMATEGTSQADASETIANLQRQLQLLQEAAGMTSQNADAAEGIAARL